LFGTIPTQVGLLTRLQDLYLNHNGFAGSLPHTIGALTNLKGL